MLYKSIHDVSYNLLILFHYYTVVFFVRKKIFSFLLYIRIYNNENVSFIFIYIQDNALNKHLYKVSFDHRAIVSIEQQFCTA